MGKRSTRNKYGDTKVLYKKSQQTLYTQSRTCSAISQLHTRSGIVQIKNNLSQHQYYVDGKKVKRDLSTETGICIFRRHYKNKRNRLSTQGGSKSLYSTINTEIDTIEELQHETPRKNSEFTNNEHNDITKLIMNNFKYLIDNWIEKYLLENKDAKVKKESVLYSLLHRTELDKTSTSSSRSTYVLNRERLSQEVKNKKIETASIKCQYCQNRNWVKRSKECWKESSCHSTPASHKNIKVISTLSIPKNLHRRKYNKDSKSGRKITKSKQNVVLSFNKPSKLLDCSSFDLLTISTKSFTKRCATYDCDGKKKKQKKKRHIVFLPKPFYKSATDSTTDDNKRKTRESKKPNLENMPSLMKSIYADDPANITSTDDNVRFFRNDNFTMTDTNDSLLEVLTNKTENKSKDLIDEYESEFLQESILNEQDISDPMMTIDFVNESLVFSRLLQPKTDGVVTNTQATTMDTRGTTQSQIEYHKHTKSKRKNKRLAKFHKKDRRNGRTSHDKNSHRQSPNLLNQCQNIVDYLTDLGNKTNMKLDIHITVHPVNNLENKSTDMSKQDLNIYEKSKTIIYNVETTPLDKPTLSITKSDLKNDNIIIPLLDAAVNQSKYILKSRTCSEKCISQNNTSTTERSTITEAKINDDISELRSIIQDLTKAAEAFVRGHVKKETKPSQCRKPINNKMENISRGIKSKEISKHPLSSRVNLSKESKKTDKNELFTRLMRKSTSYNIIDSESILRVTDMTSAANEMNKISKSAKSLPNSKSIKGVTDDMYKKKQLAYFYDQFDKEDLIYNTCSPASSKKRQKPKQKCKDSMSDIESGDAMRLINSDCNGCKSSSMTCSVEDGLGTCSRGPGSCRRGGMGFGEEQLTSKMQFVEESKTSKVKKVKTKPHTIFPKEYPSYVVAFSLKETYDDLITAQQMICNKKSPQESTNSITPTNSLKMFDTEQFDKLNQILDKPEGEVTEENNKNVPIDNMHSIESMTPTNSLKYLSSSDVSDASQITIGGQEYMVDNNRTEDLVTHDCDTYAANIEIDEAATEKSREDFENTEEKEYINICYNSLESLTNETPKIDNSLVAENEIGDTKEKPGDIVSKEELESKSSRKCKKRRILKRKGNNTVSIKQKNFKYKNPNKLIDNRLEKYYEKRNFIDADQIQKELYSDEVSTVVSRTRVLHKIKAPENLLEETEFVSFINDLGLNEYDNESLTSSMSTAKKSVVSNLSQNTLTQKSSTTSAKESENKITVDSIIKNPIENGPYKTDVINVAVAVAYNRSKINAKNDTVNVPSNEKLRHLGSLTSSELITPFAANLTPDITSSHYEDFNAVTIETSDETLVNKNSSFGVSSDDFVIARTSSDFTRTSDESTFTMKNKVETVVNIETMAVAPLNENKPTLLETVINLGLYPEMTPSTSSDTPYDYSYDDVIVANNLNNPYGINSNKGDTKEHDVTQNVLRKTINHQKDKVANKTINLPNQADIKAMLKDTDIPQMKCAEESRHPQYLPEMWDRLILVLDIAVKRLENNLIEKLTKELKSIIGHHFPDYPVNTKAAASTGDVKVDTDQGLQCDLVKNTIIDQIVHKLSTEGPKIMTPGFTMKLQQSKLFKDFEVLKTPELNELLTDTATVSTFTYDVCSFRHLKTLFSVPVNFLRENVFVLTSVPTFFVILLCVYGLIVFFMKPW